MNKNDEHIARACDGVGEECTMPREAVRQGGAVDVHALLRDAETQKAARAKQLPTEQDCIRMMVQCRLRLIELGWREGEYAPRDGSEFTAINAGFRGPVTCIHLGSGYFTADGGDWWPSPRPIVYRAQTKEQQHG